MTRFSRALALSLLLAGAAPAFAAATYTSDLLLSADFKAPWAKATQGIKNLPKWVRSGNGTSSPLEAVAGPPIRAARSVNLTTAPATTCNCWWMPRPSGCGAC